MEVTLNANTVGLLAAVCTNQGSVKPRILVLLASEINNRGWMDGYIVSSMYDWYIKDNDVSVPCIVKDTARRTTDVMTISVSNDDSHGITIELIDEYGRAIARVHPFE